VAKIIPYQKRRFQPIDFIRADDLMSTGPAGQLNLFAPPTPSIENNTLPLSENVFDFALKLDLRNDPTAEDYYLRSIENNENTAPSLCNLGVIAAHKQKMVEALDFFTKALIEDPRHFESHFNLANAYFSLGQFRLAILHFQLVIQIAPNFADVYFNLGLAFLEIEDLKAANIAFQNYKVLKPDQHTDHINLLLQSLASLI
jgi:tetratricopeptide (TPR) repeat protein